MNYFVTGAIGFIGRHLVELLLQRDGDIYALVRESSAERLAARIEGWSPQAKARGKPVTGDLGAPRLGVEDVTRDTLPGRFHHVSSIAAAGTFNGLFREDMFDEGQKLEHSAPLKIRV